MLKKAERKAWTPRLSEVTPTSKAQTTAPQSAHSPVDHIMSLHQTLGNRAVQRLYRSGLLKAKLRIGQSNDIYEQEADRVADQVMRMPENIAISGQLSAISGGNDRIQTKPG